MKYSYHKAFFKKTFNVVNRFLFYCSFYKHKCQDINIICHLVLQTGWLKQLYTSATLNQMNWNCSSFVVSLCSNFKVTEILELTF